MKIGHRESGRRLRASGSFSRRAIRAAELFAKYQSQFGRLYAAALAFRSATDRALAPIDAYLLRVEGARGTLGPAHRRYRGQTPLDNRAMWSSYDWSSGGEEWGPRPGRLALIQEVLIGRLSLDSVIVEVGPGAGRWSAELQPLAEKLVLVDVTAEAVEICRRRFSDVANVEVSLTNGASLPDVAADTVDLVWSMEAFVHMAPVDVAAYVGEISRVLRPSGFAVIHHAGRYYPSGWRAPMTKQLFAKIAADRGLSVERQFQSWENGRFDVRASHDVITILTRTATWQARCRP